MLSNAQARLEFWQWNCLGYMALSSGPGFPVRGRDLEQVEPIKPHAGRGRSVVEAWRPSVPGAERTLVYPLLGTDKPRDRVVFWYGTEDLGPLLVSKKVVGAIARLWRGWSQVMKGPHDVPSRGWHSYDPCFVGS